MKCGNCGATLDGHRCLTDKKAEIEDGDISICFHCGEVCKFVNGELVVVDVKDLPKNVQGAIRRIEDARHMVLRV